MIKEPEEEDLTNDQFLYIRDYINNIEKEIINNSTRKDFYNSICNLIDVDTFIDWWIVQEISQNPEIKWPKSSYMYKDINGKLKAGPLWDFDYRTFVPNIEKWVCVDALWYKYLFKNAQFKNRTIEKWNERKDEFEKIISFVDSVALYNRKSAIKDMDKWPLEDDVNVNGDKGLSYDDAVNRIKNSILDRIGWIDRNILDL